MPRCELKAGRQVAAWIAELASQLNAPANLTVIGSAALLWHAQNRDLPAELPEASMDVDTVTDSDEVARHCYEAVIGSEFEQHHGWHINLIPDHVLAHLPTGWQLRATHKTIGHLHLVVPAPADLLAPKLKRNEPRDRVQAEWARRIGLLD